MPVPTGTYYDRNIWVAAGEGDLERVQELVENEFLSPNVPDLYTYTPMHAAASYGHIHVLEYLLSKGGDVNVKDEDGETPLFTVESVDVARWLVEHGASIDCLNQEGYTPAQHIAQEFPSVSAYLQSLSSSSARLPITTPSQPSHYSTEHAATEITQSILSDAHTIIERAELEGRDPDDELREMVGRAVLGGVFVGAALAQDDGSEEDLNDQGRRLGSHNSGSDSKRLKFDEAGR